MFQKIVPVFSESTVNVPVLTPLQRLKMLTAQANVELEAMERDERVQVLGAMQEALRDADTDEKITFLEIWLGDFNGN